MCVVTYIHLLLFEWTKGGLGGQKEKEEGLQINVKVKSRKRNEWRACIWDLNVVTQSDLPSPSFNEIVSVAELVKACNGLGALM